MLFPNALGLLLRLLVMNIGQGVVRAQNAIKVTVGANDTLLFKPRSMHAEAGDFILFDFYDVRLLFPCFPSCFPMDSTPLESPICSQFHIFC